MKKTKKQHQGSIVFMFLLALPVIITMMAIALDTGHAYIAKTELQNAVDSCALAAANELDGTSTQISRAQQAGILTANMHKVGMQSTAVAMTTAGVTFSDTLSGAYSGSPSTANYVKCSLSQSVNKLIQVPGLSASDTISAQAIAGQVPAQKPCILPIGVCSNASAITSNTVGAWISGTVGSNITCSGNSGCFRWVVYNGATANASNLQNLLTGNNTCNVNLSGQSVTEFAGSAASPYDEYNTRFGVQKGSNTVNPDLTGYGYTPTTFPAASSAYSDYVSKKANLTKYQGSLPGYTVIQPTVSNAKPRRVGIVPVIPCSGGTSSATSWRCVLMLNPIASQPANRTLYLEYLGSANSGACAEMLMAGSGSSSGPTVSALVQ